MESYAFELVSEFQEKKKGFRIFPEAFA